MAAPEPILEVRHLQQYFPVHGSRREVVHAVDDVSFTVQPGETFGLVGESGCGKSALARAIIRVTEPTGGQILFQGQDITHRKGRELQTVRREMQMVFQDPYSSLNGRMTVRDILCEPLVANRLGTGAEQTEKAAEALRKVGLSPDFLGRYPHEFSGGQRQRICIARTLILNPRMVLCDEAISALDVSVQAQVVNLLRDFQREMGFTYLFIAHNLAMVRYVSHRVGVMYLGQLVEVCRSEEIYRAPLHPYTQGLLKAIPVPDPDAGRAEERPSLEGEVPSPIHPPEGCRFHTRCPYAEERCRREAPVLTDRGGGHLVSCHRAAGIP